MKLKIKVTVFKWNSFFKIREARKGERFFRIYLLIKYKFIMVY